LDNKTDSIGTLRKNRVQLPKDAIETKLKLERVVKYEESTGIMFTKWKDKKDVHLLSTCIADGIIEVIRVGKAKNIPPTTTWEVSIGQQQHGRCR